MSAEIEQITFDMEDCKDIKSSKPNESGTSVTSFDFNSWINDNNIAMYFDVFTDHDMTKLENITTLNSKFRQFLEDKRLIAHPNDLGRIVSVIQQLQRKKELREIVNLSPQNQEIAALNAMDRMSIEINKIKKQYEEEWSKSHNTLKLKTERIKDKINNIFENIQIVLNVKKDALLKEAEQIAPTQQKLDEIVTKCEYTILQHKIEIHQQQSHENEDKKEAEHEFALKHNKVLDSLHKDLKQLRDSLKETQIESKDYDFLLNNRSLDGAKYFIDKIGIISNGDKDNEDDAKLVKTETSKQRIKSDEYHREIISEFIELEAELNENKKEAEKIKTELSQELTVTKNELNDKKEETKKLQLEIKNLSKQLPFKQMSVNPPVLGELLKWKGDSKSNMKVRKNPSKKHVIFIPQNKLLIYGDSMDENKKGTYINVESIITKDEKIEKRIDPKYLGLWFIVVGKRRSLFLGCADKKEHKKWCDAISVV